MNTILIVDDEKGINDLIALNLRLVGYQCLQAFDGDEAAVLAEAARPDLVLLDIMLPNRDGFELMADNVFQKSPVIYLTARGNVADRVRGLNLGADDYIVKPFEAVELIARVEAVLRRTSAPRGADEITVIGGTVINASERTATVGGEPVELTNREFELLAVLIRNRNLALSREKLLSLVWGYDYLGDARTVDVHITKLRKKLNLENDIKTVYKYGYRLEIKQ